MDTSIYCKFVYNGINLNLSDIWLVIYAKNYFDLARNKWNIMECNIRNKWNINGAKQISSNVCIYLILKYWDENTRGMENVRVKKKKKRKKYSTACERGKMIDNLAKFLFGEIPQRWR